MRRPRRVSPLPALALAVAASWPTVARAAGWVEVRVAGTAVHAAPSAVAPRLGTLRAGARVRVDGGREGPGCRGPWLELAGSGGAASGFVCGDGVRLAPDAASPGDASVPATTAAAPADGSDLLPRTQAFVAVDATPAYARPSDWLGGRFAESLGAGFSIVVVGRRVEHGVAFVETRRGLFVEEAAVRYAEPSAFHGVVLEPSGPDAPLPAFSLRGGVAVRDRPGGRTTGRLGHRTPVGTSGRVRRGWVELAGGGWVRDRELARARPLSAWPADLREDERWVEVDLVEQVAVARVGRAPVWATLVSTGRPGHPTPTGEFRVWVKLESSNMSDLERTDVSRNYALEAVPWVLYFAEGVGFHATFWHDAFGTPQSHGCVNLAPRDARFLFGFAPPVLPAGWSAILPTEDDPGMRVWVHE